MANALRHVHSVPWAEPRPRPAQTRTPTPTPSRWRLFVARAHDTVAPLAVVAEAGYATALVAVAVATGVALVLGLGSEPGIFAPFLVAVVAVALRHGIGPAVVVIVVAAVVIYAWFFAPLLALAFDPNALRRLALFRIGVFASAGLTMTLIAEAHRQSLEQLERSRRQLRAFTANDEIGLQIVDHEGRITWADGGTARFLGFEPGEFAGEPFARFHVDVALAADVVARLAAGHPVENVRTTLRRKDGTTLDVLVNSNTLLGDARVAGAGVLVAVLPLKPAVPAVDGTKLAVAVLLERRRKAAERRAPAPASDPQRNPS